MDTSLRVSACIGADGEKRRKKRIALKAQSA